LNVLHRQTHPLQISTPLDFIELNGRWYF